MRDFNSAAVFRGYPELTGNSHSDGTVHAVGGMDERRQKWRRAKRCKRKPNGK